MAGLPYAIEFHWPLNLIFFLINITCSIILVSGNGIVVYVVLTVKHLQNPSNYLLMALSSADLLAGGIAQPLCDTYFGFFGTSNSCNVERSCMFLSATSCATSILLLCLIARDRYLHISKGPAYNQFTSESKISLLILGSRVIGLVTAASFILQGSGFRQFIGFAVFSSVQMFSFVYILVKYLHIKKYLQKHLRLVTY